LWKKNLSSVLGYLTLILLFGVSMNNNIVWTSSDLACHQQIYWGININNIVLSFTLTPNKKNELHWPPCSCLNNYLILVNIICFNQQLLSLVISQKNLNIQNPLFSILIKIWESTQSTKQFLGSYFLYIKCSFWLWLFWFIYLTQVSQLPMPKMKYYTMNLIYSCGNLKAFIQISLLVWMLWKLDNYFN